MDYQRIHDEIIDRAKSENRKKIKGGIYYELHHIKPRCLGGLDEKENLVLLTAREHFLVHWLLAEIYDIDSLWYAFNKMCLKKEGQQRITPSSRIIEYVKLKTLPYKKRIRSEKELSQLRTNFAGHKHTEESKKKTSEACKKWWAIPEKKEEELRRRKERNDLKPKKVFVKTRESKRPINQYDLQNNFIQTFSSISEASKTLNIGFYVIYNMVTSRHKVRNPKFIFKDAS